MSTTTLPVNGKATASSKSKSVQQARKKRVVRRRGRGPSGMGSDDEIERDAVTDSDTDDDNDQSSLDSATDDSDTEPASEDSPSHLESPPAPTVVGDVNGASAPFFATSSTWSDMVADEATHGAVGLPVVDFAEFDGQVKAPARKAKKQKQKKQQQQQRQVKAAAATGAVQTVESIAEEQDEPSAIDGNEGEENTTAHTGMRSDSMPPRKLGQTARQAYQQRLEADPSYVPKVGGFWGHDDRLMDKDLRSLSGWWRGKWSGRGGRGRGFGMRGGFHGGNEGHESKSADLPPVERQWTHDGFEEMKRKEDHRRQDGPLPPRGRGGHRGGRGRGRGGAFGPSRHTHAQQETELAESRQSEATLFEEVKGKGGKAAIRVKLPGKGGQIAHSKGPIDAKASAAVSEKAPVASSTYQPHYTVKLPKGKPKAPTEPSNVPPAAAEGPSSEVQPAAPPVALPTALPNSSIVSQLGQLSLAVTPSNPERQAQTEEAVLRKAGSVASAEGNPEPDTATSEHRPALPPLQTVFTPPPPPPVNHQSPTFGSPYNFPQALPPGIAMNQHGIPYEVSTGRPVYLQPPPQPMYNPQPMHYPPPGMYMHGPMHHPIASPDYHAQQQPPSHTPPVNGFVDPATGQPIFSLPRSVRIEIRAPGEARGANPPIHHRNPSSPPQVTVKPPLSTNSSSSKLRTGATSFEPSGEFNHANRTPSESSSHPPSYEGYENGPPPPSHHHQHQQQYGGHPQMMHYGGYQHQGYYYPEAAYGYPAYVDMPHGQYEMYNPEQQGQQGTAYY